MAADSPEDTGEFELKLMFLRELDAGYRPARAAHERLMEQPSDPQSLQVLASFFHRISGTAASVDLVLLGHLAAICEEVANLALKGQVGSVKKVVQILSDGLAGVGSTLDAGGVFPSDRPLVRAAPATVGLTQPGTFGEDRVLSKVLIIDDDPFSARLIDGCLKGVGLMSSYCCDSERAVDVIRTELPDLIVLDVAMPKVDGFDVCRRVRAHPALQFTPIIFVTRKGDLEERVRGLEVGGNDYISKPFEPQELVARVRAHLARLSELRDMAIRDGLTRCFNHKYFKMRLDQEIARAHRYKEKLVVAMLDLDHFKSINDTYGHQVGDAVLSDVSNLISASVRSTDVVARYGGEEFGIIFIKAGAEEAVIINNRIRERIANHAFLLRQHSATEPTALPTPVTVSIGLAQCEAADSPHSLIQRADQAMYQAKRGGRNQVHVLTEFTSTGASPD